MNWLPILIDHLWRTAYRIAYPLARIWWRLRHPHYRGVLVAVYVDDALLLLRSSYRSAWNLPGGGVQTGENLRTAAIRELREETGIVAALSSLQPAGIEIGLWNGRNEHVFYFILQLPERPNLVLDNREIIEALWVCPSALAGLKVTEASEAFLGQAV